MSQVLSLADARSAAAPRAHQLADRLERGMHRLRAFAETLVPSEWRTPVPGDGRTVGVVVHHVASVYPLEIQLARTIADGEPIRGVTMADVHAMNAAHARQHAGATKEEALALLAANGTAAAAAIRALTDEQLSRAAAASLYDDAELTCQFVLEDHAVRHSDHHLARIRAALGR
jgi:hypothetical protein